jgi:hypothetical protein
VENVTAKNTNRVLAERERETEAERVLGNF